MVTREYNRMLESRAGRLFLRFLNHQKRGKPPPGKNIAGPAIC
jgi:hypothetical protein